MVCAVFCRLVAHRSRTHHMRRAPVCVIVPCASRCGIWGWCSWWLQLWQGCCRACCGLLPRLWSGRVLLWLPGYGLAVGEGLVNCATPWGCLIVGVVCIGRAHGLRGGRADAWVGAVDTRAGTTKICEHPARLVADSGCPCAFAHTHCAILVILPVTVACVKSAGRECQPAGRQAPRPRHCRPCGRVPVCPIA